MSEKKLKIGLELDDKAFTSAVKRMQDQLNQIQSGPALQQQQRQISQKMQSLGLGTLPGAPNDRQMEQTQQKAKQQSDKLFRDTTTNMESIKRSQKELNKELENSLTTEEKKLKIRKQLEELNEKEIRTTGELRSQTDRHNAQTQAQNKQLSGRLMGAAGLIGGVGSFIGAQGRLPIEAASAQGSAVSNLVGQQLKDMTDPSHQAFMPERAKAMDAAKKAWKAGRIEDKMLNAAGVIAAAVGIAGLATAETLSAGLATPAVLAGGAAIMGMVASPKQRALLSGNDEAYEKLSAKDLSDLTTQSQRAAEEADPLKKLAADYNSQNYQRNLGVQRGLGLSDKEFMGKSGFLQGNMAYGGNMQFTEDQVTGMQQSIMGAGGSARAGREAGFGLELQKNLGLTNAPQIMGGLSKTLGGADQTKEASIRVITEAFKQGLNDSDLVDLLRGFTQSTSEVIARSGARSQGDVGRITDQFGKGMLENTGVGLEAAKTGYDAYQRLSGSTGGPFSVMQRAAMLRNPILNKVVTQGGEDGALVFEKLKQIPSDQLTEDHPAVQAAVTIYNKGLKPGEKSITAADLISAKISTDVAGASISGSFFRNKSIVDKARKSGVETPESAQAFRMMTIAATTNGVGSAPELTTAQSMNSYGANLTNKRPDVYGPSEALKSNNGRSGDQVNANVAAGQQAFIENFEKFKDNIIPAANNIDALTKKIMLLGQIAADIAAGKKPAEDLGRGATSLLGTQPQADSSSAVGFKR